MKEKWAVAAVAVIIILAGASFGVYESYSGSHSAASGCLSIPAGSMVRSQTSPTAFGPVTEYGISGPDRWASAVTVGPDGSIWFVEQEVPGVARLFPSNNTLVEYAWQGYPKPSPSLSCENPVSSAGIALWEGKVWAADEYHGAIVGTNPDNGATTIVNVSSRVLPFWLAVGPDGNLWFTSDNFAPPQYLGEVFPNMTAAYFTLTGIGAGYVPLQLVFVNSTLAFIATLTQESAPSGDCVCNGHIYSFDPATVSSTLAPGLVGGNFTLILPTSVSYSQGRVWVTEHAASAMASYDFASGTWTRYPTSRVPWTNTTLTYYTAADESGVWFNEHEGNKMATIDPAAGTLTEISDSMPPASNSSGVQNDEYIALSGSSLVFTSLTGNYVGILNTSYVPGFSIGFAGSNEASLIPGGSGSFPVTVSGEWASAMNVSVSDSENPLSVPVLIRLTPSVAVVPAGGSPYTFQLGVSAASSLQPGKYTIAVTVTEGVVQQTAYLFLDVT